MSYVAHLPRRTRGLTRDQRKRLRQALETFYKKARREKWHLPKHAANSCNWASDDFLHCLTNFDLEEAADIEHYDFDVTSCHEPTRLEVDYSRWRYPFPWSGQWHWAVRLGANLIIDWTARQFSKEASFPALWIDDRPKDVELYCMVSRDGHRHFIPDDIRSDDRNSSQESWDSSRSLRLREMPPAPEEIRRMAASLARGR